MPRTDAFKGSTTEEAARLGVSRRTVFNWRQRSRRRSTGGSAEVLP
jgi:transposase-like protein